MYTPAYRLLRRKLISGQVCKLIHTSRVRQVLVVGSLNDVHASFTSSEARAFLINAVVEFSKRVLEVLPHHLVVWLGVRSRSEARTDASEQCQLKEHRCEVSKTITA